ncbi:MAG TPA: hypothetical protein VGE16_08630 [Albitalea sp.]
MQIALSVLVFSFIVVVGSWPLACLAVAAHLAVTRRWRALGQVALLLPLWTIAASVGALQLAPLLARAEAPVSPTATLVAATGVGVAVCLAAVAWMLLIRSFRRPPSPDQAGVSRRSP